MDSSMCSSHSGGRPASRSRNRTTAECEPSRRA
jgi:hypothetical protein